MLQQTQYNIVMIFLESWSSYFMYRGNEQFTPFFDSIKKKSLTTLEMLANGSRTTEGLFATLCSAQNPLGQTIVNSFLQRDVAPTMLDLLNLPIPLWFSGRSLLRPSLRGVDYYQNGLLGWTVQDRRVEVNIKNRSLSKCYKRQGRKWIITPCNKSYQELANQRLAFTLYSQELLFSNKVKEFGIFDPKLPGL